MFIETVEIYRQILPFACLVVAAGLSVGLLFDWVRRAVKPACPPSLRSGVGRRAVFLIVFLKGIEAIVLSAAIYRLWKDNPVSKFLLPPYQSINYFIQYAGYRFILPFLFSLMIAAAFFWAAKLLNEKRERERRLFEKEEYLFLFLGIFMTGHPLWIVYLAAVLIIGALIHAGRWVLTTLSFRQKRNVTPSEEGEFKKEFIFSFYYLWLPVLFFVLLFNQWLLKLPLISELKF